MRIVALILQILLGLIFILSALAKLYPVEYLEFIFVEKGISGWNLSPYLARGLIAFELLLGLLLLFGQLLNGWVLRISFLTLLVFTLYTLLLVIKGEDEDCGCFGELIKLTPLQSLLKNILLLLISLFLFRRHFSWKTRFSDVLTFTLLLISLSLPFVLNPVYFSEVQVTEGEIPEEMPRKLSDGTMIPAGEDTFVLAMLSPTCPHCRVAARKLYLMKENQEIPPVYAVFWGKESLIPEFFEASRSEFPYAIWNDKGFLQMTEGKFPVILVVEDGKIVRELNPLSLTVENINGTD